MTQSISCDDVTYWYHPNYLGNVEWITNTEGYPVQFMWYSPWGEVLHEDHSGIGNFSSRYKFNGKELDDETGLYYYGARYYDPLVSNWLSVDPLANEFPSWTPYHYVHNNPVNMIDPDGRAANPIYGEDGEFLGTDSRGLQGEAIVMNKDNFKQGMDHKEALEKGTLYSDLPMVYSSEMRGKIEGHFSGLPDRPDYDGKLTLSEANEWYRERGGDPLYIDIGKLNLRGIDEGDFPKGEGSVEVVNLLFKGNASDGLVLGNIAFKYLGNKKVGSPHSGYHDTYDFEMHKGNSLQTKVRNFETWVGERVAGKGTPYKIYPYGTGRIGR